MKQQCTTCPRQFVDSAKRRSRCSHCRTPRDGCACGAIKLAESSECAKCRSARTGEANYSYRGGATRHQKGYILEKCPERGKYIFQHVLVMEDHLGRRLFPGETVHHKYGIKDDNRIENLELWTKPQPTGIRVEDAVEHARSVLQRYAPGELK